MAFFVDFALSGKHKSQAHRCPDHGDVSQRSGGQAQPFGGKVIEKGINNNIVDANGNHQYQQKTGCRRGKNQFKNPSIAGKHPVKRNVFGLSDPLFALCRLFRFPKKQRTFKCLGQKSKEINAPQRRDDTEFLHQNDGNRGQKSGGQLHHSNR